MEKDNKYYDLIKNLIKTHRKYNNGYEPIIDDLIDDVYKHAKAVIGSVKDEEVISSYLQKLISVSIITVPKRMNFHNDIPHRVISQTPAAATPIRNDIPPVQEVVQTESNVVAPAPEINKEDSIETPDNNVPKANVEFVDKMINSINEDSLNEPDELTEEDTTAEGIQEQIDELETELSEENTDDELILPEETTETLDIIEPAEPENDYILESDGEENNDISDENMTEILSDDSDLPEQEEISEEITPETDLSSSETEENEGLMSEITETLEEPEDNNIFSLEELDEEESDNVESKDTELLDENTEEVEYIEDLNQLEEEEEDIAQQEDTEVLAEITNDEEVSELDFEEENLIEPEDTVVLNEVSEESDDLQELDLIEEETVIPEDTEEASNIELTTEETEYITDFGEEVLLNQEDETPLELSEYEQPEETEDLTDLSEDFSEDLSEDFTLSDEAENIEAIENNDDIMSFDTAETLEELPVENNFEIADDIDLSENTVENENTESIEPESNIYSISELDADTETEEIDCEPEEDNFDSDIALEQEDSAETASDEDFPYSETPTYEEKVFKPIDYSLFNFAQKEENTEAPDVQDIENKLNELNTQKPDLNIVKVFDLKYKQNLSVAKIAEELNTDIQTVVSALDEIVELI